jgi:hypothetical protein
MKRIFSFLFAILFAVGTTGVFTSCQEDAPEITINITMNNDFSDVVNAINNGTMKQEAAIAALTAAIEKMQGDQDSKLQAIADAINSLATTVDAKLAIIEAAMKAQTLALETKLDLLEAAIKALPDYSDQLEAIAAAVEAIPDYSDKLAALETALEAIADNIKAQEGQYADELAALKASIDAIKSEVAAGNTSQEDALAQIIALLESGAIAGGGSGSGSGGEGSGGEGTGGEGEGGEGSGDEPTGQYISFTTEKPVNSTIDFACYESELTKIDGIKGGVEGLERVGSWFNNVPIYRGTLTKQEVKLYGTFTKFSCINGFLTKIDTGTQSSSLGVIDLEKNSDLAYDFKFNTKLSYIQLEGVKHTKLELSYLVENLQNRTESDKARCFVTYDGVKDAETDALEKAAEAKGWDFYIDYTTN